MKWIGCFKEFEEEEKAYATVSGSIEQNPFDKEHEMGIMLLMLSRG
jgi:hypothetical protein